MSFTPLPDPPSRSDPSNFNDRADALFEALPIFVEEANKLIPGETAAGLAQFLASADADKGAALVRFSALGSYPSGTLGARLAQSMSPTDYPWLAKGDGTSDDTLALAAFFAALPNGTVADLGGRTYLVHANNNGVSTGDAALITAIPRLSSKSGITIRNGTIAASSPGTASSKVRYPCTLVIDGCTDIKLNDLVLKSRGESYGDSDASVSLGAEARRTFCAVNGGHALLIMRSRNVKCMNIRTERCGSSASFYVSSCADVELGNCYSAPMSLGYAAYAFDSWMGGAAVTGYSQHDAVLNNCRTDANGATYGSKGGVAVEDVDVVVRVNGGVFCDSYANGSTNYLGAAFINSGASLYVNGAQVENCAAVGLTYHSANVTATLECAGVVARKLRTAFHINANNSFGTSIVSYRECSGAFSSASALWPALELSRVCVVANMKTASAISVLLMNCTISTAHTLAINSKACYGGIRIVGGTYTLSDRIFDSAGWGGAIAGSRRGFEIMGGTKIFLAATLPGNAVTSSSNAINVIKNLSAEGVSTYQWVDIDDTVTIESIVQRLTESIQDSSGGVLVERRRLNAELINCGSSTARSKSTRMIVRSLDGIFGSNYRVTVGLPDGFAAVGLTWDDTNAIRNILSLQTTPVFTSGELRVQINLSGTGNAFTVGGTYPVLSR